MTKRAFVALVVGAMYTGKTEWLIRRYNELKSQGKMVIAFKHHLDSRYDKSTGEKCYIVSHLKSQIEAYSISDPLEILEKLKQLRKRKGRDYIPPHTVFIDEFQFFQGDQVTRLLMVKESLVRRGINVVFAGLDMDFRREEFKATTRLKASFRTRGEVILLVGPCRCGDTGRFSQRRHNGKPASLDSPQILPEGTAGYTYRSPVCEKCHSESASEEVRVPTLSYKDR